MPDKALQEGKTPVVCLAEKKERGGGDLWGGQNDQANLTAEKLSREYGVSAPTIRRDAKFAEAVAKLPPKEREGVLSIDQIMKPSPALLFSSRA